ncbi:MAG: carboxypeptidase regulatory-like domain-containing protein [Terriglobales bacterium]
MQGAHSAASYGSGSVSLTSTQAGDTILVAVYVNIGGVIGPPTDTQNNAWTADTNYYSPSSFNTGMQIWRASNIAGGNDTITVRQSNSATVSNALVSVNAYEYSGLATSSPVDGVYAENSGCGTASGAAGSIATSNANDLVFVFFADPGGSALSAGSGFTQRDTFTTSGDPMLVEDDIVSSTGIYAGAAAVGGSLGCNEGMMVAYKAAGAVSAAVAYVQGAHSAASYGSGAVSFATTKAGDTILAAVFVNIGGAISPPTDSQNNIWTADTNYYAAGSFNTGMQIWRASNIAGGGDTITVHQSNSATVGNALVSVNAYEYSGLAIISPVDGVYAESSGCATASAATGPVTTTDASDLLFVFFADPGDSPLSPGSGFTPRDSFTTGGNPMLVEQEIVSSTGTYTGTATVGGSLGCNEGMMVAYKAAAGAISGTISGAGGNGATVTLSGAASATTTANSSGAYTFSGLASGSYTVTPSLSGFTFSPGSQPVTVGSVNVTGVNFSTVTYTLSGTISGAGGNGATVTLSGAASATTTANSSGAYTFTGLASGSYTVTPSLSGFTFSPGSQPVTVGSVNVTGVNFSTVTYTLSGTVSGAGGNGATVTLSGAASATTTANSSGAYTFTGLASGSYTVTPSLSGFTFSPASQPVTVGSVNVTAVNFSTVTYTLSGTISGAGGNGATVTLSGAASATTTANSSGAYTFTGLASGSYTVTPSLSGFTFSPASQPVTVGSVNVTGVNFSTVTYTLSGTISGAGGNGTTVTLSGAASATTTANSSGAYTFSGLASGSYTVTPSLSGFTFTPGSQPVTVGSVNVTGVNFSTVTSSTYSISGSLSPSANGSAATVTLSGAATATTTADASGNFSFSGLASGAYTVAASKSGFAISPASQAVTVSGASVTGVSFTAAIALAIDAIATGDGSVAGTSLASGALTTTSANELLLACIASDAKTAGVTVTGVSGGGLTWTLVRRTNAQMGTAEVWRAFAPAQLSSVAVTATFSQSVVASITVVSFTGADATGANGSGAIGANASASAASGAPTASLATTRNNSWVFGVGDDWDKATARTLGANQTMIHQLLASSADTYWVQRQNSTTALSGTSVTINDTAPTTDRYNLTIVEVLPPAAGVVATYGIYGTLSPAAQGSGATVTLSGAASATTTADSSGNYAFSGLANGSYTVTPAKSGIIFLPTSQTVTVDGFSMKAVNFSVLVPTWSLSGNLSPAASGSGATLTLGGAGSSTTTADSSGNYTFSGLTSGTYSVTPSKSGYAFSPVAQSATISGANVANVNFTVSVASIAVSLSPAAVSLLTGGTQQFTATVTGTTNTTVTWTSTGGAVTSKGLFTAPSTTGSYTVKATSAADTTKSASATVTVTTASSSTVLLGDANVETQVGSVPSGQAEAFQATATASGAMQSLVVYLDSTSTASQLSVGLYADASGHPGALLSQASSTTPVAGAWNPILVPAATLASGTPYWIAILGTTSGTLAFREATPGSCASEINAQTSLTSLPASWTTGTVGSNCPASVFGDSTKVVFFDNFPGTTLSSYWTVISRHGEYTQDETECNVPSMVAVNNGLTITTEAQSASCGDYFTAASSWPYITGDIQWTNLNFTYGSIEIEAKFPSVNTSLWPATWLLGTNCQYTNPLTGNTGVTINGHTCPDIGTGNYTEIDMTECYGGASGWCQFHVADPNFYTPCDGNYSVDTNFHTFTTVWNSSGITQYMDGTSRATCNQQLSLPMFLLIQTQTGGAGGTPNNSLLPAELVVTYVKVTQP